MSVNTTTNRVNYTGYVFKEENAAYNSVAPTTTAGHNPGDVWYVTSTGTPAGTISAVYRFDGTNNKWIKFPGTVVLPITPKLAPVISRLTTPPTVLNDQARYIITATATGAWAGKEGQIAEYDAANLAWVYYTPTNLDQTTVTTGTEAGVYQYDSTSKTWVLIKQGVDLAEPTDPQEAGNFRLTSERQLAYTPNGIWSVIANDAVAAWGNDSMLNAGDGSNSSTSVRKLSVNWMNGTDTAYSKGASYYPKFVDAVYSVNGGHVLALDSVGKVWAMGSNNTSTGLTTTATGTTLMGRQPTYGFAPIPYFQSGAGASVTVAKIYTMTDKGNSVANVTNFAVAIDGTVHCVGRNNFGQLGVGTTVDRVQWATHPINQVKYLYMTWAGVALLQKNGNLHFSGSDAATMAGGGAKTSPVLVLTGVDTSNKDTVCFLDRSGVSAYAVKPDGTLWVTGANANGQLGRGNTTAQAGFVQVAGVNDAWKVFAPMAAVSNWFCLLRKDGSVSFAGNNTNGVFGYGAVNTNYNTLVTPTGAFQGTVVDVVPSGQNCYLITTDGAVWVAGNLDHAGVGVNGLGSNRWVQMSFPEPVIGLRTMYSNAGTSSAIALTPNHQIYEWGTFAGALQWNTVTAASYAPMTVPVEFVDNSIGLSSAPTSLLDQTAVASLTGVTAVTSIVDGGANQVVTFTVSYTASTLGVYALSLSSLTGTNISAGAVLNTSSFFITASSGTLSVQVTLSATDDTTLVAPNTKAQDYALTLNGTALTANGLRTTDAKVGALSTSLAAYNAAANNTWVPITAAEGAAVRAAISGFIVGSTDAKITGSTINVGGFTNAPNTIIQTRDQTIAETVVGTMPANSYMVLARIKTTSMAGARFGFTTPQMTSGTTSPAIATFTQVGNSITDTVSGTADRWFIMKGDGASPTADANFSWVTNTTSDNVPYIASTGAGRGSGYNGGTVTTSANAQTTPNVSISGASWLFAIQGYVTTTKQW